MSLKLIERQIFAQRAREAEKAKPMAESLAAALQGEIDKAVNAAVEAALASHQEALRRAKAMQPVHAPSPDLQRRLEALERRLQATTTVPQIHHLQVERDAAGLIRAVNIAGGQRLLVQRNAEGFISAMAPADTTAPVTYAGRPVKPAPINRMGD